MTKHVIHFMFMLLEDFNYINKICKIHLNLEFLCVKIMSIQF